MNQDAANQPGTRAVSCSLRVMDDEFSRKVSRYASDSQSIRIEMLSEDEGRAKLLEVTADVVRFLEGTEIPLVPLGKKSFFSRRESGWLLGPIMGDGKMSFNAVAECVISTSGAFCFDVGIHRRNGVPFEASAVEERFRALAARIGRYPAGHIAEYGALGILGEGPVMRSLSSPAWDSRPQWQTLSDFFARLLSETLKQYS